MHPGNLRSKSLVKTFWSQEVRIHKDSNIFVPATTKFTGNGVPIRKKPNDRDVIYFVTTDPCAVSLTLIETEAN